MKIVVICKSDSTGGAAVVSRRLTEALREAGADAGMLVLEKRSGFPFVTKASYPLLKPLSFIAERIYILFGFLKHRLPLSYIRQNIWKIDTGAFGLPLWRHPLVKEADAVILNWVNQGMLSLKGVDKICASGKKVIWNMHDMWNITGICHHALECSRFQSKCECCPYLKSSGPDLSTAVWRKKSKLYSENVIHFVAVSRWLANEAKKSALLKDEEVTVIPNTFKTLPSSQPSAARRQSTPVILFSAAILDNWIKELDTFREAVNLLATRVPSLRVILLGAVKSQASLEGFDVAVTHLGLITDEAVIAGIYSEADVVVSTSRFETFGATLAEAQLYGAVPVAFDRGGQSDIIDHLVTGYLAHWSDNRHERAAGIARGMEWALSQPADIKYRMRKNAESRFSYDSVARSYLNLLTPPQNTRFKRL